MENLLSIYAPEKGVLRFESVLLIPDLNKRLASILGKKAILFDVRDFVHGKITLHDLRMKQDAEYKAIYDKEKVFVAELERLGRGACEVEPFVKKYGQNSLPLRERMFDGEKISSIDFDSSLFDLSFFVDIEHVEKVGFTFGQYAVDEPNTLSITEYIEKYNYKGEIAESFYKDNCRVKEHFYPVSEFMEKYKNGRPIKMTDFDTQSLESQKELIKDRNGMYKNEFAAYETAFSELDAMERITKDLILLNEVEAEIYSIEDILECEQFVMKNRKWNAAHYIVPYIEKRLKEIFAKRCEPVLDEPIEGNENKDTHAFLIELARELGVFDYFEKNGFKEGATTRYKEKQTIILKRLFGVKVPSDKSTMSKKLLKNEAQNKAAKQFIDEVRTGANKYRYKK